MSWRTRCRGPMRSGVEGRCTASRRPFGRPGRGWRLLDRGSGVKGQGCERLPCRSRTADGLDGRLKSACADDAFAAASVLNGRAAWQWLRTEHGADDELAGRARLSHRQRLQRIGKHQHQGEQYKQALVAPQLCKPEWSGDPRHRRMSSATGRHSPMRQIGTRRCRKICGSRPTLPQLCRRGR